MTIRPDAELSAWAGQAAWADPATNNTCRQCIHWAKPGERVARSRYNYFDKYELAPRPCLKARALNSAINAAVPYDATACKHFKASPAPPPIWAKHTRRDS